MFTVRTATPDDAMAMAVAQVEGWRTAYRGLVPQGHLDAIDLRARAQQWHRYVVEGVVRGLVVESRAGEDGARVVGMAVMTPGPAGGAHGQDDTRGGNGGAEPSSEAMVTAFYVLPEAWGTGAAQALMAETERVLAAEPFARARLSVLAGNPRARRFYEKAGWSTDGREIVHEARQPGMPGPVELTVVEYTKALTPWVDE